MPKPSKNTPIRKAKRVNNSHFPLRNAAKNGRIDTKSALIFKLLGRASVATVRELAAATNWQDHSIRGYLSGTLKKKLGLLVTSEVSDGTRHYKVDLHGTGQ